MPLHPTTRAHEDLSSEALHFKKLLVLSGIQVQLGQHDCTGRPTSIAW